MKLHVSTCFALIALASIRVGGQPVRTHDITIDDYFTIANIDDCAISPDGKLVAYVQRRWEPPAESRNSDLWVVDIATKATRRLTFDPSADTSPHWSADSRSIYFTSSPRRAGETNPPHDGATQVWRINSDGGDLQAVTRIAGGIDSFDLSADGATLYYTVSTETIDDEWASLRAKYKDFIEASTTRADTSELWKLDLQTWRSEKLIAEKRRIREFSVSPDQKRIAMLTTPDARLITNEGWSRLDVFDTATREISSPPDKLWRADAPSSFGWLENLAWSSDGEALAFTVAFDGYPSEILVCGSLSTQPEVKRLSRPDDVYVVGRLRWKAGSSGLCYIGDRRALQHIFFAPNALTDAGRGTVALTGDYVVDSYTLPAGAGGPIAVASGTTFYQDLFAIAATPDQGEPGAPPRERLTMINPQMQTWKLPQISRVQWNAPDGVAVHGVLELPPGYKTGDSPLPLVVDLHGGPTASSQWRFEFHSYGRTMFPAAGYALLSPNYRGSTGYGDKFLVDLIGRENDIDVSDILAGVDEMVKRGIADADRLGVIGWSNGGYLTNCLITTTDRFKAASSGAGVLHQVMQWGNQDTPGHNINFMQGQPWEKPDAYRKASPLYNLHKVKTPTLIHVGGNDERVPALHSRTLFRALDRYLQVPCRLLVYPGEGHGLSKMSQRRAKMEWDLAWFDRYVRNQSSKRPELPRAVE